MQGRSARESNSTSGQKHQSNTKTHVAVFLIQQTPDVSETYGGGPTCLDPDGTGCLLGVGGAEVHHPDVSHLGRLPDGGEGGAGAALAQLFEEPFHLCEGWEKEGRIKEGEHKYSFSYLTNRAQSRSVLEKKGKQQSLTKENISCKIKRKYTWD